MPQKPGCARISASSELLPETSRLTPRLGVCPGHWQASSLAVGYSRGGGRAVTCPAHILQSWLYLKSQGEMILPLSLKTSVLFNLPRQLERFKSHLRDNALRRVWECRQGISGEHPQRKECGSTVLWAGIFGWIKAQRREKRVERQHSSLCVLRAEAVWPAASHFLSPRLPITVGQTLSFIHIHTHC